MKYMLLVCTDQSVEAPAEEAAAMHRSVISWIQEMTERGVLIQAQRLSLPSDATTVRVRGGEILLGDGPFAETKEQIAGFDVIDCANLDEAIEVAAKNPLAKFGTIEVRPLWAE